MAAKNSQVTKNWYLHRTSSLVEGDLFIKVSRLVDLVEADSFTDLNGCVSNVWT